MDGLSTACLQTGTRRKTVGALANEKVQSLLNKLHDRASGDTLRWTERKARETGSEDGILRLSEFYLAVSPEEGHFLYLLARASKARNLVEFGASFGISTLYLVAAAADNGGHLMATKIQPEKCASVRDHLDRAGLSDHATVVEGDARETLKEVGGPVDFVLLDGWKSTYLPVLQLLRPKLSDGAVIAADNWDHDSAGEYIAHVQHPSSGFTTNVVGTMGVSCLTG